MAKVLYIKANPNEEEKSFSLAIGASFIEEYKRVNPNDEIVELDLYNMEVPFIDGDVLHGWNLLRQGKQSEDLTETQRNKVQKISLLTEQFIKADKYVFVSPMWNLGLPPKLKAYVDTFFIAGKSFKYTENGPVGLLNNKKAVHIQARGGIYSEGPGLEMEFGDRYLRTVMNFLGVASFESIIAEGMAYMPSEAEKIKSMAIHRAIEVVKEFAKNDELVVAV